MKDNFRVDIIYGQTYECVVDSNFLIFKVEPHLLDFYLKDLRKVFNKFKTSAEFHFIGYVDPQPFVPEDIFEIFMHINPNIKILVEEFDLDL